MTASAKERGWLSCGTQMAAVTKVLIVGGGIAGMTLAIGLKRAGIYAEIIEINPQCQCWASEFLCKRQRCERSK